MLNTAQQTSAEGVIARHYLKGVLSFEQAGATLSETDGGQMVASWPIGDGLLPTLRFAKSKVAEQDFVQKTLRNLDKAIVNAQLSAIAKTVTAAMPLTSAEVEAYIAEHYPVPAK